MSASTAAGQILEVAERMAKDNDEQQALSRKQPWWRKVMNRHASKERSTSSSATTVGPDTRAVALARVGAGDMKIVSGTLAEIAGLDLGPPLHTLVILAKELHPLEQEALLQFAIKEQSRQ